MNKFPLQSSSAINKLLFSNQGENVLKLFILFDCCIVSCITSYNIKGMGFVLYQWIMECKVDSVIFLMRYHTWLMKFVNHAQLFRLITTIEVNTSSIYHAIDKMTKNLFIKVIKTQYIFTFAKIGQKCLIRQNWRKVECVSVVVF